MSNSNRPEKYLIVDFGASLIHTHHSQSIYSFFDLVSSQDARPEIWLPLGSNLNSEVYPSEFKILPGTHGCAFNFHSLKTWIPGIISKVNSIALKFNLKFLLRVSVYLISIHFCSKVLRLKKKYELSIIFPTMCAFAIKSVYILEKLKVYCRIYCRTTNSIEIQDKWSKIYSIYPLLKDSKSFSFLKVKFGAETNHNFLAIKQFNDNSYLSKFPSIEAKILGKTENSNITISFLGHPTRDKGHNHILGIIQNISRERSDIKWQVHVYENDPLESLLMNFDPEIHIIRGKVENAIIHEALIRTDVLCLPYDVQAFKFKASAMHYKASDYLKPIITFSGTEFAREIEKFESGTSAADTNELCEKIITLTSSQISYWQNGCRNYNLFRNSLNIDFLDL